MIVRIQPEFSAWRKVARTLLADHTEPARIRWYEADDARLDLLPETVAAPRPPSAALTVPAGFLEAAETVACARDPSVWALLYSLLYRLQHESRDLLERVTDDEVRAFLLLQKEVSRDVHKMHAFVRFRKVEEPEETYVAWHRPQHRILRLAAPFFARRFGDRRWCILTPDGSATWDGATLSYGPPVRREGRGLPGDVPADEMDDLWRTYYRSIFNPARLNPAAMAKEMPRRYWATLPEAEVIAELLHDAPRRIQEMKAAYRPEADVPLTRDLGLLSAAARDCRACPLHEAATRTVFGTGPAGAALMIVGEQPGDQEDLAGEPFVGPAGELLRAAMVEADLSMEETYVTNAVKHFKFKRVGKRRLHERASGHERTTCRPWLQAEREAVRPRLVLALGVTAAISLLGREPRLSAERGRVIATPEGPVMLSWHPAFILRLEDPGAREARRAELLADLRQARDHLFASAQ